MGKCFLCFWMVCVVAGCAGRVHGGVPERCVFRVFPRYENSGCRMNGPVIFIAAWAGLALDSVYQIDVIRYIFRNDDNNVRKGDRYELLYLSGGRWLSAGIQTADTISLHYENVPSNTLYWLRNHTRGKEERPFTYEDGIQVWW